MRRHAWFGLVLVIAGTASAQKATVLQTLADGSKLLERTDAAFVEGDRGLPAAGVVLRVMPDTPLQRMDGFGASMTDSSAALLMQLAPSEREETMKLLFDPAGPLGLTLLRQPLGASDFSAHGNYSYDDLERGGTDEKLEHFSIAQDEARIFPLLREALSLNPQLRLMVLPWSAPSWMKTSRAMNGGALEDRWIGVYAHYLARTVAAYAKDGLPVYAMALQNEPENENETYPTQRMSPGQEIALAQQVRPLLRNAGFPTLLLGYEHNWSDTEYPRRLLATQGLFDGISFHCYRGHEEAQRDIFAAGHPASVWFTECSGVNSGTFANDLMWQARHLLLGAPLNGARSVMLWNLVLRPDGGPHNGGCSDCRALLTLHMRNGRVMWTRNVEFYLMAHAAPFVHPDAQMLPVVVSPSSSVTAAAFRNVDGTFAVLVLNEGGAGVAADIEIDGKHLRQELPRRSLTTVGWGTPHPAVQEGTYRLRSSHGDCLEISPEPGHTLAHVACAGAAAQLWSVSRLSRGRFEVRSVVAGDGLAVDARGEVQAIAVDGDHTSAVLLTPGNAGVCISAAAEACEAAKEWVLMPSAH